MSTSSRLLSIALACAASLAPAAVLAGPDDGPEDTSEKGPVATSTTPKPGEPKPAKEPEAKPKPASDEPTAADVADAPLPGQESGIVAGKPGGDGVGRIFF